MDKSIDLGLPIGPNAALDLGAILDPERLLRLHPHWHVEAVETQGRHTSARLKDHATEKQFEFVFELTFPGQLEVLITCTTGPVARIHFFPRDQRLHVSFTSPGGELSPEAEQDLTLWLQSIRQYLRLYFTTTPYTLFFRFLMNKAMLKMDPSQRKICLMLYRFTLLEIVVILIIVIGYFTLGR